MHTIQEQLSQLDANLYTHDIQVSIQTYHTEGFRKKELTRRVSSMFTGFQTSGPFTITSIIL